MSQNSGTWRLDSFDFFGDFEQFLNAFFFVSLILRRAPFWSFSLMKWCEAIDLGPWNNPSFWRISCRKDTATFVRKGRENKEGFEISHFFLIFCTSIHGILRCTIETILFVIFCENTATNSFWMLFVRAQILRKTSSSQGIYFIDRRQLGCWQKAFGCFVWSIAQVASLQQVGVGFLTFLPQSQFRWTWKPIFLKETIIFDPFYLLLGRCHDSCKQKRVKAAVWILLLVVKETQWVWSSWGEFVFYLRFEDRNFWLYFFWMLGSSWLQIEFLRWPVHIASPVLSCFTCALVNASVRRLRVYGWQISVKTITQGAHTHGSNKGQAQGTI